MIAWLRYSLSRTPMTPRAVQRETVVAAFLLGVIGGLLACLAGLL